MNTYFLEQLITPSHPHQLPPCVLTIGNFDGVHLGHQQMLAQVQEQAKQMQLTSAVMIFEPQPREFFTPERAPARLTNLAEKQALLAEYGVETLIIAGFDAEFRALSAKAFADILADKLNVRALVLGDDFHFGHDRTGDSQFLRDYGLQVTNLHTVMDASVTPERISSTRVRKLLLAGDIEAANTLLGRDYAITGTVIHGDKIGRQLNFPTANIELSRIKPALHGIFAVDVVRLDDKGGVITDGFAPLVQNAQMGLTGLRAHSLFGTANIGLRPSVNNEKEWRLEVHFPKLNANLYGERLQVRFLHFLHGEKKYAGLDALKAGIQDDVEKLLVWRERVLVSRLD
ncbi:MULTISPECIES: bifunctional riboflavin kinase/FAD synthetase [unclassified Psychrobacter]|uniref:bifunctional riboflavin kinase/FAD synthetase n=1 Tax=unclassified Psychrobacter TaxID=196806 RepID=UPI0018F4B5A9|nr:MULTISPECIES: bifunctional riboflavin kinase/FAD synthetase [unclassified Psychrobacter]